jgi:hypothetical protein
MIGVRRDLRRSDIRFVSTAVASAIVIVIGVMECMWGGGRLFLDGNLPTSPNNFLQGSKYNHGRFSSVVLPLTGPYARRIWESLRVRSCTFADIVDVCGDCDASML